MKTIRDILKDKAKTIRDELDLIEEIQYTNRKDELDRLRLARKDEKTIEYMRSVIKNRGSK